MFNINIKIKEIIKFVKYLFFKKICKSKNSIAENIDNINGIIIMKVFKLGIRFQPINLFN